jgi:RHS repeat-associated protein
MTIALGSRFVFDLSLPGQRYDAMTGLYYNYFRDYDAATGRYIQVDLIGLAGGIDPYLYANGSPWRYTDANGNFPLPVITAAIGLISAAVGDTAVQVYGMYRSDWCKDFNWRELGVSAVGGGLTGLGLPAVSAAAGVGGVAAVGALSNVSVYAANDGDMGDMRGVAWAAGTGAAGGFVGGTASRVVRWGSKGTAASASMIARSNNAADARLNTGAGSLLRGAGGGIASGAPMPSGTSSVCGCDH